MILKPCKAKSDIGDLWRVVSFERGETLGWQLDADPSRFRIQTIDALNASITRARCRFAARFGAQPESGTTPPNCTAKPSRATIVWWMTTFRLPEYVKALLSHLDNDARGRIALARMLVGSRCAAPLAIGFDDRIALKAVITRRARAIAQVALWFPPEEKSETPCVGALQGHCGLRAAPVLGFCVKIFRIHGLKLKPTRGVAVLADGQHARWTQPEGCVSRHQRQPNAGFPGETVAEEKHLQRAKKRMKDLLERLATAPPELNWNRAGPFAQPAGAAHRDADWRILSAITSLLPVWRLRFCGTPLPNAGNALCGNHRRLVRALGPDHEPTGSRVRRLDYRIRHLLVDEFRTPSRTGASGKAGSDEKRRWPHLLCGDPMADLPISQCRSRFNCGDAFWCVAAWPWSRR